MRLFVYSSWIFKMWRFVISCLEISCLCIYSLHQRQRSSPIFSHWVLGVLPRQVWRQRSCSVSLFSQLWEYLRASRKWESIGLGLSGSVGMKGHVVAETVAEAPAFLLHPSFHDILPYLSLSSTVPRKKEPEF